MSTDISAAPRAELSASQLDALVTRRQSSLFHEDIRAEAANIDRLMRGRRVLVIGGGGSIGSATTQLLLEYGPSSVHVVDHSENYLAELVRHLRGRPGGLPDTIDFHALPIDYGGPVMERLLAESAPYDIVLNFAALKHVRSEKDIYSVLQMLDTNVVKHIRFKQWLARGMHGARYFAVSTDKAANPTSLMGASKRLMEDLVFEVATEAALVTTSARFANVAFSNGSLLQGFRYRLERFQPLSAPNESKRYFVSHQEAGELCMLAAFCAPDNHIIFPRMEPETELQSLQDIAVRMLEAHGYRAEFFDREDGARRWLRELAGSGRWPVLLTPLDTSGEKPYEEFVGKGEVPIDIDLKTVSAIRHMTSVATDGLFEKIATAVNEPTSTIDKANIVSMISSRLANFRHVESERHLDQQL
ncbi:polysaccharide biosynthesis protein [Bradyrhizobium sp. UFLA05-109]